MTQAQIDGLKRLKGNTLLDMFISYEQKLGRPMICLEEFDEYESMVGAIRREILDRMEGERA